MLHEMLHGTSIQKLRRREAQGKPTFGRAGIPLIRAKPTVDHGRRHVPPRRLPTAALPSVVDVLKLVSQGAAPLDLQLTRNHPDAIAVGRAPHPGPQLLPVKSQALEQSQLAPRVRGLH